MKVLIACEYSGTIRDAFSKQGHDAWSCDFEPTDTPGNHYQGNVKDIINDGWDLMIAHPPCTHLAVSGSRWFKDKQEEQKEALEFVRFLMSADIDKIAIENPISVISTQIRKPDQIINPYQFGDPHCKKTCLWLKNLERLKPTNIVIPTKTTTRTGRVYDSWWYATSMLPLSIRGKARSKTFQGIADAMASQWG